MQPLMPFGNFLRRELASIASSNPDPFAVDVSIALLAIVPMQPRIAL